MTAPTVKNERSLSVKSLNIVAKDIIAEAVKALGKNPTEEQLKAIRVPCGMMYGIVTGVKEQVNNRNGEIQGVLVGQFEGKNVKTGETVRAIRCYVPMVQEQIEAEFNTVKPNVREGRRLKFQANIYLVHSADGDYPYNWDIELPMANVNSDPLSDMRNDIEPMAM